jgi:hypothetical protein
VREYEHIVTCGYGCSLFCASSHLFGVPDTGPVILLTSGQTIKCWGWKWVTMCFSGCKFRWRC